MTASDPVTAQVRDVGLPARQPPRQVREAFDRSVAVALGINGYVHGIPRLSTAVPDVEAIAVRLERDHGFTTVLRRDAEVTNNSVRALFEHELQALLGGPLGERDRLLVYFAGHGLALPSDRGPEGHLLLSDADPGDPRSFFAMSELRQLIGALPCRHVLIVLDCCFAGTFRWAGQRISRHVPGRAFLETLDRYVRHRAWQVLVSTSHDQEAIDAMRALAAPASPAQTLVDALRAHRAEAEVHSPFATALMRALDGHADYTRDGLITATELELFVRDAVEQATRVRQTPQLYKLEEHDRGEFVFQVPGEPLCLDPAPALSLTACPYQGLQPFGAAERGRFYGRGEAVAALIARVAAHPLTVLLGPSGTGKSSLLAAGLLPALGDDPGWTVLAARPDTTPDTTLRDLIPAPPNVVLALNASVFERITAWLPAHPGQRLCLAIDQAEGLDVLVAPELRDRVLGELAQALEAHGARLRVVLALRSDFEPVFRASRLGPLWDAAVFAIPTLAQHELREIIERPARALELAFDPPGLVDMLINESCRRPAVCRCCRSRCASCTRAARRATVIACSPSPTTPPWDG